MLESPQLGMIIQHNQKYLVLPTEVSHHYFNDRHQQLFHYLILNCLEIPSTIKSQVFSQWVNLLPTEAPRSLSVVLQDLLAILDVYVEHSLIITVPKEMLQVNIMAFSSSEFPIDKYLSGFVVQPDNYLLQYLTSRFTNGTISEPGECISIIQKFSDNPYVDVDISTVFNGYFHSDPVE